MNGIMRRLTVYLLAALGAVLLSAVAYAAGSMAGGTVASRPTAARPIEGFDLFWEAWRLVERDFAGEIPPMEEVDRAVARGLLRELDDAATGLVAPQYARLDREDASGYYRGIGASVRNSADGNIEVSVVFAGSPAEEAGILPGDVIVAVDGEFIAGIGVHEAVSRIRGPEGTTVRLELRRPGEPGTFTRVVDRRSIEIPTVAMRMLEGGIAHITLNEFNNRATAQLRDALRRATDDGVTAIVLDLRNNPGGFLDQAVSVADEFLDAGTVVIERGREVTERSFHSEEGGLAVNIPLAILVNEGSASASEIVAGAVQARGRGVLVGTQTYGKGSVQYLFDLSDGSQIRVTTALWYTPDDRLIQGYGLTPDVAVEDDPETEEDEQLSASLTHVREEIH